MTVRLFRPASLGQGVRLLSVAAHVPSQVVRNEDLVARGAPLSAADMHKLTGILERRWALPHEAASDLGAAAGRLALDASGLSSADIQRLVVATVSPDHPSPSTACAIQHALGMAPAPSFDVSAACSGFVYALDASARAVATGDQAVMAVATDVRSRYLDVTHRTTCALFGDGACAAVLAPGKVGEGILGMALAADGRGVKSVHVPAGGSRRPASLETVRNKEHFIAMADGPEVYFQAVEGMLGMAEAVLSGLSLSFADIACIAPHQANGRLLERLSKLGKFPSSKLLVNVDRYGNTAGASCGIALSEALTTGRVRAGDLILLLAAGGGYTAGAAVIACDDALLENARFTP